eukprot:Em0023g574a
MKGNRLYTTCLKLRSFLGRFHGTLPQGPDLKSFIARSTEVLPVEDIVPGHEVDKVPYLKDDDSKGQSRKVYFETYGCQMNVNDTEIAWSVLKDAGFARTVEIHEADVILAVTCAIRENAEKKVWSRLDYFKSLKRKRPSSQPPLKVGLLGCMAERLKTQLLDTDKMVDVVAGPDAYRDLPRMLTVTEAGQTAVNVLLSVDETYADIMPVRMNKDSPSAYVSIMRGCENMCSFCIVPFTRGKERSRPIESILNEVRMLSSEGVKEVTLLGQNVNSYRDLSESSVPLYYEDTTHLSKGFRSIYRNREGGRRFADLLHHVSLVDPEMRVRFTSPHPKDFPDELLQLISERSNICKQIHLPAQSGSSVVLERMRRGYTRDSYLELVRNIRSIVPEATLSSDFIAGFCGETEEDHRETLSLMEAVQFDMAYMYAYSMRKKTHAYHQMRDDVPEGTKQRRLQEIVDCFHAIAAVRNRRFVGTEQLVLVETESKRSKEELVGRSDGNIKIIFKDVEMVPDKRRARPGDYIKVNITDATSLTLKGVPTALTQLQKHRPISLTERLGEETCLTHNSISLSHI